MAAYPDNFNRADGPLGDAWTVIAGSGAVASDQASLAAYTDVLASNDTESGNQDHYIQIKCVGTTAARVGIIEKANADCSEYLTGAFATYQNVGNVYVAYKAGGSLHTYGYQEFSTTGRTSFTLRVVYTHPNLAVYVDGDLILTVELGGYVANNHFGMKAFDEAGLIDAFDDVAGSTATLTVAPDPVYVGAGPVDMTATLNGEAWTVGVPGSSTLTADHGTVTEQYIDSATTMHFIYEPADYVGAVVFTESEFSLTDTVTATLVPPEGGGGAECRLTIAGADLVNRSGAEYTEGNILTDAHVVHLSPVMNVPSAIDYLILLVRNLFQPSPPWDPGEVTPDPRLDLIWNAINGGVEQPVGLWTPTTDPPVKIDTENIRAKLNALTATYTDLNQVVNLLGGSPTLYSHADLKIGIDAIDWPAILAKLDLIQPNQLISLSDLAGQLQSMVTIAGYNLGDILAAIAALNPATAPGLTASTASILGAIAALALEVASIGVAETADAASSAAAAVGIAGVAAEVAGIIASIATILADLATIKAGLGSETFHPPVWPGLAHVTMGAPVALGSSLVIPGPMHGIRVEITGTDPGTGFYDYDVDRCWRNIGAVSFVSDVGDHEHWQPLGFSRCVYVPQTMTYAASCKLHLGRGPVGTITPWSYAP